MASSTPFGDMEFGDGVQTWLNPLLAPRPVQPPAQDTSAAIRGRLESANEKNRVLKDETEALRARVRALEDKLEARERKSFRLRSWFGKT
jgi:hypothetical protein